MGVRQRSSSENMVVSRSGCRILTADSGESLPGESKRATKAARAIIVCIRADARSRLRIAAGPLPRCKSAAARVRPTCLAVTPPQFPVNGLLPCVNLLRKLCLRAFNASMRTRFRVTLSAPGLLRAVRKNRASFMSSRLVSKPTWDLPAKGSRRVAYGLVSEHIRAHLYMEFVTQRQQQIPQKAVDGA